MLVNANTWPRASISASLRLSTTVTFAEEVDTMYFIGPLLFWACAEMTCGFFILCVPCLPAIIKDSGLSRKVKSALGLSNSSAKQPSNSDIVTFGGTGGPAASNKKSKSGLSHNDTYYKIDEEEGGMPMKDLGMTESQERLHNQKEHGHAQITRTMQVTVTSDSRSAQSGSDSGDNSMPWARVR